MSAGTVQRSPSQSLERIIQGLNVRAEERLAKHLTAKGKHREAVAAEDRVHHCELISSDGG